MKVTGWTYWEDERYGDLPNDEFDMAWSVVGSTLCGCHYKFTGTYHQNGDYGVPIIDDKWKFTVSQRTWGQLMAEAYPDICDGDGMDYVLWAWMAPEPMVIPNIGKVDIHEELEDLL